MNKAILIGRLTAKPELRYTKSGVPVTSFTLAVKRDYVPANGVDTDFINVTAWKQKAEFCAKYLDKGKLIALEGTIQTGSYENGAGEKRKIFDVLATQIQILTPKKSSEPQEDQYVTEESQEGLFDPDNTDLPF